MVTRTIVLPAQEASARMQQAIQQLRGGVVEGLATGDDHKWWPTRHDAAKARCGGIYDGPWEARDSNLGEFLLVGRYPTGKFAGRQTVICWFRDMESNEGVDIRTAEFIAHARQDLPDALTEIERLAGEVVSLDDENRRLREIVQDLACWPVDTLQAVGARCPACGEDKWHAHSPSCLWVRAARVMDGVRSGDDRPGRAH